MSSLEIACATHGEVKSWATPNFDALCPQCRNEKFKAWLAENPAPYCENPFTSSFEISDWSPLK